MSICISVPANGGAFSRCQTPSATTVIVGFGFRRHDAKRPNLQETES
jgi:hypothetical protein